jgi:hypothetical protein
LAVYIALSARRNSAPTLSTASSSKAIPMLAHVCTTAPPARTSRAQEHSELVSAEPGDQIAGAGAGLQAAAHADEQLIAGVVTEAVVHRLELIEIHEQEGSALLRAVPCAESGFYLFDKVIAVR